MSKTQAVRGMLTDEVLSLLAGLPFEHVGYTLQRPHNVTPSRWCSLLAGLYAAGVVGAADGLTITGSGVVAQLRAERMDALFS